MDGKLGLLIVVFGPQWTSRGWGDSRAVDEQLEGWSDERKEEGDPIPEPMVMMIPILHTLAVNGQ